MSYPSRNLTKISTDSGTGPKHVKKYSCITACIHYGMQLSNTRPMPNLPRRTDGCSPGALVSSGVVDTISMQMTFCLIMTRRTK